MVDDEFEQMQIKGNRKIHMISYFPDGEIQVKEALCSCSKCSLGRLVECENCMTGPKGKVYMKVTDSLSDENSEDDDESEDDYDDDEEYDEEYGKDAELSDMEENGLFKHTNYSDTIMVDSFIGIYSHEMANEPFFIWRKKCVIENIHDDNNHYVPAGTNYMVCNNYLQKVSENFNQRTVQYKLVTKSSIYIIYEQVFYPSVPVSTILMASGKYKLTIDLTDYLWLSDCV